MSDERDYYRHHRSYFWPFLLISAGVVWIMINQGLIEPKSLNLVFRFWPVLLVIAGLQIMFGRKFPWLHNLFLAAIFAGMVFVLYRAEDLQLIQVNELTTETFVSAGIPETGKVKFDIEYGDIEVTGNAEMTDFLIAEVTHDGDLTFIDNEKDNRDVRLILENNEFMVFDFDWFDDFDVQTNVELTTETMLDFTVELSSGSGDFKLSDLSLEQLVIEVSSGNMTIELPPGEYPAIIRGSSGNVEASVANGTNVNLQIEVSSGNILVYLPEDSEGIINIEVGSGNVELVIPDSVGVRLTGSMSSGDIDFDVFMKHSGASNSGTWETANFDDAEYQLEIEFDISSGNLIIE